MEADPRLTGGQKPIDVEDGVSRRQPHSNLSAFRIERGPCENADSTEQAPRWASLLLRLPCDTGMRTTASFEAQILETAERVETRRMTQRISQTGSCKTQTRDVPLFFPADIGASVSLAVSPIPASALRSASASSPFPFGCWCDGFAGRRSVGPTGRVAGRVTCAVCAWRMVVRDLGAWSLCAL